MANVDPIIPWDDPAVMLFADTDEVMTVEAAVLRWRNLPAVTHALCEIQTLDMRTRAETWKPDQIEAMSRLLADKKA